MFNLYTGLPGSGKSLMMTIEVYRFLIKGYTVYSDYWINYKGDNLKYFNDIEDICDKRNAIVVFDEISALLEPRAWEQETKEIRRFFSQHRKRHITIFATTQHRSQVAKTVRNIVHYWCQMTNYTNTEGIKGKQGIGAKLPFLLLREQPIDRTNIEDDNPRLEGGFFSLISQLIYLSKKHDIVCPQFDKYKLEHEHQYCPECRQAQDPKEVIAGKCPKCKGKTEKRKSGIYDTDREVSTKKKKVITKYFTECESCGKLQKA